MLEAWWLGPLARLVVGAENTVCAGVFCFFLAEMQEQFVVGEEGRLGVLDLLGWKG